ncbi:hypothetical protein TRFO_28135 [Tritrichomonas foetus]|uniref:Uncharacterized protein n=1 Tax=Tritrichomonas foetus TaxID=1144522 RepID=A0A1J4JZG3_9EUKA|nr:hypothetical protein TRFO_28135 [Tritrichomonas foetus]|eukprot:OHT04371.1 hypothetical protein TRFO_28135 [Tritrichomonas foetus]
MKYEDSITIDNVIQRIDDKLSLHSQISNSFSNSNSVSIHNYLEEEILFVSSHFYEISKENIERLDLSIIELILKNQKLMILNEDSLFSFILSLYLKDHSYGILFEYIEFQNLNPNSFEQFITLFDLCDLNLSIWSSICKRLVEEVQNTNNSFNNKRYFIKYSIPYNNQNFEGILHFLTKENQKTGNSNINEFIEIQAS